MIDDGTKKRRNPKKVRKRKKKPRVIRIPARRSVREGRQRWRRRDDARQMMCVCPLQDLSRAAPTLLLPVLPCLQSRMTAGIPLGVFFSHPYTNARRRLAKPETSHLPTHGVAEKERERARAREREESRRRRRVQRHWLGSHHEDE